jgi:hypothetical protein
MNTGSVAALLLMGLFVARGYDDFPAQSLEVKVFFVVFLSVGVMMATAALKLKFEPSGPANQPLQRTPDSPSIPKTDAPGPAPLS